MRPLPRSRSTRVLTATVAAASLLAACGGGETRTAALPGQAGEASSGVGAVTIERSRFGPAEVTIPAGGTVEFTNLDAFDHTVTATDASPLEFDSGDLGRDETFTQRFDDAGTYDYFCTIHPTMRATVIVE